MPVMAMTMTIGMHVAMTMTMGTHVAMTMTVDVLADVATAMGVMAVMAALGGGRCGNQHDGEGCDQYQEALADRHWAFSQGFNDV
jgi:hypothetical protein